MPPHPPLQATFLLSILFPNVAHAHWAALEGSASISGLGTTIKCCYLWGTCSSLGSASQMHPLRLSRAPLHLCHPAWCLLSVQYADGCMQKWFSGRKACD